MRKRQTFLLTIISTDNGEASICGKVKVISTGRSRNFSNMQELYELISSELEDKPLANLPASAIVGRSPSQDSYRTS